MKKNILGLIIGLLLVGSNVFAADGDLIVNGNVGIGTTNPLAKLDVRGLIKVSNQEITINSNQIWKSVTTGSPHLFLQYSTEGGAVIIGDNVGEPNNLIVNGAAYIGKTVVANEAIEVNQQNGGNRYAYIDLHGDDTYTDYSLRLMRHNGGPDAASSLDHRGTGPLILQAIEAAPIFFYTNNNERMRIQSDGNVVIGTGYPGSFKLYVSGTAYSTGGWQSSDLRFKENMKPIDSPLNKILNMEGISFDWKKDEFKEKGFPEGRHYGVVAQKVENVLPEIVKEGPGGEKSVSYTEIVPVLIEAIKEQQKEIERLKMEVTELKTRN